MLHALFPALPMWVSWLMPFLWASSSTAEVICNPSVPQNLLPELASCDYALHQLEFEQRRRGHGNIIFSPSAKGAYVYELPSIYVGAGPNYTPAALTWCAILILWQPRPTAKPPLFDEDVFPFDKVLRAAYDIRNQCLLGKPGKLPQIGREWISPSEFVDVQIAGVFAPVKGAIVQMNNDRLPAANANVTLQSADGTYTNASWKSLEKGIAKLS